MSTRIKTRFDTLRKSQEKGFIAYICAGDPSLQDTIDVALSLEGAGVDVLELGVPFSDPLADGKVNQEASARALQNGASLKGVLGAVEGIRKKSEIPIVWASNFSTGVNTLFWLTRKATEVLGTDFDLEVVEMHHRLKRDAPSGTAATLAEILAEVRKVSLEKELRHGRDGIVGERTDSEIGIHSLRGGDVVGDHTVVYAGNGERLELTHKAASRDTFANGALRAATWACGQAPGLYNMENVLGLK